MIHAAPLRTATEAEEQAAQDEAIERRLLPMVVLAQRGLVARVDVGEFLEQVEQRSRDRRLLSDRIAGSGPDDKPWLRIRLPEDVFDVSTIAVFSQGSWILSVRARASPGMALQPEVAIDRSIGASALVRELLAEGLARPDEAHHPVDLPPDELTNAGLLERFGAAMRMLLTRVSRGSFLDQVEQRCRDRKLEFERMPRDGAELGPWANIVLPEAQFGKSSLAVFGEGSWIISIHVQSMAPEVAIDRSRGAAALLREVLADGLEFISSGEGPSLPPEEAD